jgi:hypothetical protein
MTKNEQLVIHRLLGGLYSILSDNNELDEQLVDKAWQLCNTAIYWLDECNADGEITLPYVFSVMPWCGKLDIEPDINCRCIQGNEVYIVARSDQKADE